MTRRSARLRLLALALVGAFGCIASSCIYIEAAGRSVGESLGFVAPPTPKDSYGEPIVEPIPPQATTPNR